VNRISVHELDATSNDVFDSLLALSGPCALSLEIKRLVREALVDLVGELVALLA
jgi:hypothetical protein